MNLKKVVVRASARYVPEKVMTNDDFAKFLDTSDEWITQRTGIKERRFRAEGESCSTMAIEVGKKLLDRSGVDPADIGLVIIPTVTPDYVFPATGTIVAAKLGCVNAAAWDIEAACGGFITALYSAWGILATGERRYALVIGSEVMSSIADFTDRSNCILFGDAASGLLLEGIDKSEFGIEGFDLGGDGNQWQYLYQPAGGSVKPASAATVEAREHFIKMEGQEVFKGAVRMMGKTIENVLAKTGTKVEEVDYFIPHQANARIIESTRKRIGVPEEKMYVNIQRYGNTTSASIPLCIDELNDDGKLTAGTRLVLFTFGAGFVWGAAQLRWGA
ncbi:MAG: ketoacyl-ACP synthase III [bacterium]|jgi:3-oxoacyl-[acyl-carrier-protein] synthase-3